MPDGVVAELPMSRSRDLVATAFKKKMLSILLGPPSTPSCDSPVGF